MIHEETKACERDEGVKPELSGLFWRRMAGWLQRVRAGSASGRCQSNVMRSTTNAVLSVLLLGFTSCATRSYSFADRDGLPPDVVALEKAREEHDSVPGKKGTGLGDVSWVPLFAMNAEIYNSSNAPYPKGTTYADFDAYGPLFMFASGEAYHYDEEQRLYERSDEASYLWGLASNERSDIRVPSGWHVRTNTSLLFGLLNWPATYYITNLPIDRTTKVVPTYADASDEPAK